MNDTQGLSTDELLRFAEEAAARDPTCEAEDRWDSVRELHRRGEATIFRAAATWCESADPLLRCLGADVLGQLGFDASHPFSRDSEPILMGLLSDRESRVISCALIALGHLGVGNPRTIAPLACHESADVRYSVAYCLGPRQDATSCETLIGLSSDSETDVRSWATFGLGSLSELDSPAIRVALVARLSDADQEVRGEAMLGLAVRGDKRAVPAILEELRKEEVSVLAIEAAARLPDPSFLSELEGLLEVSPDDRDISLALERCREKWLGG